MSDLFSFSNIAVEITIATSALLMILIGAIFYKSKTTKSLSFIAILVLAACIYISFTQYEEPNSIAFSGLFMSDNYTILVKSIVLFSAITSILFSISCRSINLEYLKFEYPVLILFSVLGMMIMLAANDFMSLYLGLELQTLCLYSLTCFNRLDSKSSEGALKYFILGGIASVLILYGISFIYGFSGTTNFSIFEEEYANYLGSKQIPFGILIGSILVISGFCFKIAAVPFHMWAPDVYQGAPLPVTAFLSTTPKAASIFLLAKLLMASFAVWVAAWQQVIASIAALSLFVGALGALKQINIKRLMAYSSIAHIGFILVGVAAHSKLGLEAVIIYTCIYILMNIGIFTCISMMQKSGHEDFDLSIFKGLAKSNPVIAFSAAVLLLSLAGVPPLAGFLAKFYILNAAIKSELYILAVLAMISSIISTFYYLKIIKLMYFDNNSSAVSYKLYNVENIILASSATTFNLALIVFPSSLYGFITYIVERSFN